jgi:hypothetical protein
VYAAHQKLAAYYSNADGPRGQIYNWATILDPVQRLETYKSPNPDLKLLQSCDSNFHYQYSRRYESLERASSLERPMSTPSGRMSFAALAAFKHWQNLKRAIPTKASHLIEYLSSPLSTETDILAYWQSQEQHFPGLTLMAKDVLAVPISGVGIERLFSTARQICGYVRNRLKPSTFSKMMVVKHAEGYISRKEKNNTGFGKEASTGETADDYDDTEGDYEVAERLVISEDEAEEEKRVPRKRWRKQIKMMTSETGRGSREMAT